MAKGFNKNRERNIQLNSFGRMLTKRSGAKCEFCEEKGVKLSIFEVPPLEEDVVMENCVFLCDKCLDGIERFRKLDENSLRFLNTSVWSETPIVQAVSLFILRNLKDERWVSDLLENVYVSEEIEEKASLIEL